MTRRARTFVSVACGLALSATAARAEDATVEVRGAPPAARGIGDVRINRELLEASPRQTTSEMLSAAPGFFVDHEDGEGLGNDVYLRGWDLEHGSGIEMRLGAIPLNIPTHVQGQGYADVNFLIPEVLRSIRVLEGTYDPRQGDAAIVGSADFDLGVAERGYRLGGSYGSFGQKRVVAVLAPEGLEPDDFVAFALRSSDGFGQNRASTSASANAQYVVDLGASDRLRLVATAYGAHADLPGVVRQDDVDSGRLGFYDGYPYFAANQSTKSNRVVAGAELEHDFAGGARLLVSPWFMWTDFRARQNYTGALQTSQVDPSDSGLGDLFETTNDEKAAGFEARFRHRRVRLGEAELATETGVSLRFGHTAQAKRLLVPDTLAVWDRRLDAELETLDAGVYADVDVRLFRRLRLLGGPRVDVLSQSVDDRLAGTEGLTTLSGAPLAAHRSLSGVSIGPRGTVEIEVAPALVGQVSYGEGFRSIDAAHSPPGISAPYSKVRSVETGIRAHDPRRRYQTSLSLFYTYVGNELVFVADSGGLETESASHRRGVVGSVVAKPWKWFLGSAALSVSNSTFATRAPGVSHWVSSVPPILFRSDVTARGRVFDVHGRAVSGRVGLGYTFLSGRHLTDAVVGPASHVLNAAAALRYGAVELGVDAYNVLGLKYADDAQVFVSNWSLRPGQQLASIATTLTAAPPRTVVATVTLHL